MDTNQILESAKTVGKVVGMSLLELICIAFVVFAVLGRQLNLAGTSGLFDAAMYALAIVLSSDILKGFAILRKDIGIKSDADVLEQDDSNANQ